jgi:hypothetical protein
MGQEGGISKVDTSFVVKLSLSHSAPAASGTFTINQRSNYTKGERRMEAEGDQYVQHVEVRCHGNGLSRDSQRLQMNDQ